MTTKAPLDFDTVEALRKRMLLTRQDMAALFEVSRATYYGWLAGKPLRKANDSRVRSMLRKLLSAVTEHGWPTPDVIAASPKDRKEMLDRLISGD